MDLISTVAKPEQATSRAVKSGLWSDLSTWDVPPADGGKIYIPSGITVTISGDEGETPLWTLVEGILKYDPEVPSNFSTESLFVMHHGLFEVVSNKIQQLTFPALSGQKIDWTYDPLEISRGLVAEGQVNIAGKTKTPYLSVKNLPPVGAIGIPVESAPVGWEVGDQLCYTSDKYDGEEFFVFQGYTNGIVQLDHPIQQLRIFPKNPFTGMAYQEMRLHVANLTRNIKFSSSPSAAGNRQTQAHIMLMHGPHTVSGLECINLGRTTIDEVSDAKIVDGQHQATLAPLCGLTQENTRGRYALHFHMAGPQGPKSIVNSVSIHQVRNSRMKFGFINHSSNVECKDTVVLNVDGSHFMTEEGDEVGPWINCIAIHSKGEVEGGKDSHPDDNCLLQKYPEYFQQSRLDLGWLGEGFWLQGGGVDVIDCVAAGQFNGGIDIWTRPLDFRRNNTYHIAFPTALLTDPSWVQPPKEYIEIDHVPFIVKNFQTYGVNITERYSQKMGVAIKYTGQKQSQDYPLSPYSIMFDVIAWNIRIGVDTGYAGNVHYKNVLLVQGDAIDPRNKGFGMKLGTQGGNHNKLENVRINEFQSGIGPSTDTTYVNVTIDGVPYQPPAESSDDR